MRGLLWLLVLAALAVALSLLMRGNGGYVLFVLPPWRAELSLNFLAVLVVVGFALLYFLVRLVWHTLRLPSHVRAFRRRRRAEAGHEATLGAIQALFEGRFVRAEKLASKAFDLGAAPGLAGLVAARAAQRLRDFARRDRWLEQSRQGGAEWQVAQAMTRAELLLDERRFDEARSVLHELHASGPRHVAGLFLMLRAEQGLSNWEEVLRIASALEKHDAMPPEALDSVRVNARVALLTRGDWTRRGRFASGRARRARTGSGRGWPQPRPGRSSSSGIAAGRIASSRTLSSATGTRRSRCSTVSASIGTRSTGSSAPRNGSASGRARPSCCSRWGACACSANCGGRRRATWRRASRRGRLTRPTSRSPSSTSGSGGRTRRPGISARARISPGARPASAVQIPRPASCFSG